MSAALHDESVLLLSNIVDKICISMVDAVAVHHLKHFSLMENQKSGHPEK